MEETEQNVSIVKLDAKDVLTYMVHGEKLKLVSLKQNVVILTFAGDQKLVNGVSQAHFHPNTLSSELSKKKNNFSNYGDAILQLSRSGTKRSKKQDTIESVEVKEQSISTTPQKKSKLNDGSAKHLNNSSSRL